MPATLVEMIAAAIAAHDPLDPWLVQSNFDEHYWDEAASHVAALVQRASSEQEVYELLVLAARGLVRPPEDDDYVRERLQQAAASVWRWLQSNLRRRRSADPERMSGGEARCA